MIRRLDARLLSLALLLPMSALATVFSGQVQVAGAQEIFTPPSMSSPVVLRYYVADGTKVRPGEVLLRIDAGPAETQLRTLQAQLEQMIAKNTKEIAGLELKQADAELALADIQAERDIAAVDALIPKSLISALDYDRHQGEMQRTDRALALKQLQVAQARGAVARRQQDSKLELAKQRASLVFYQAQVDGAVVRADRAGTVVHGFDSIFSEGGRYEEGSTSYPGIQVGQVVGEASGHTVQAWVLEPDRVGLRLDQPLQLHVDALPGSSFRGSISTIAGAPTERAGWGDGRYFELGIALPAGVELRLHQGMSVRVDSDLSDVQKHADKASIAHPPALKVDGEVFAQSSLAISPPSVDGLWQMTVSQMADDGQSLKKGDMLVAFEASEVVKNLTLKQGTLAENRRKQEQLRLDLADRAREAELATAQAQAETDKAQRKAHQPKDFIARVDYQKLVIARVKAERRLSLTAHRQQVALRERRAEQVMADAEVAALETEVDSLQKSLASLTVKAPRDGIVVHESSWQGGKVDVGSQIWRGQSVAQMPDLATLAVRAALPEREFTRVVKNQRVRVWVSGGDRSLSGVITEIGGTVHSKSRVDAVPVVDLIIVLDPGPSRLKPGQPVQVEVITAAEAKR